MIRPSTFVLALAIATSGQAATINISSTRDLLVAGSSVYQALPTNVPVNSGDHVVQTIDFLGNQTLTLADGLEAFGVESLGNRPTSFIVSNATLEFLDFSGTGGANTPTVSIFSYSTFDINYGAWFFGFLAPGQTITFSGVRLSYDFEFSSFDTSAIEFGADRVGFSSNFTIGGSSKVPDGGSTSAMAIGSVLACMFLRRKLFV